MPQSHERAITFTINQGERDGYLLAVLDGVALYEYEMPRGSTALRMVNEIGEEKTVAYRRLPLRWLRHLVAEGVGWNGTPQQNGKIRQGREFVPRPVPQPAELLAAKSKRE